MKIHITAIIYAFTILIIHGCSDNQTTSNSSAPVSEEKSIAIVASDSTIMIVGKTELDSLINKLFIALKTKDSIAYSKLLPNQKDIELMYINAAPINRQEELRKKMKEESFVLEEKQNWKELLGLFGRAIRRGDEMKIEWNNIIFKDLTIDSSISEKLKIKLYQGQIAFSENNSNRQLFIKFNDCFKVNNKLFLGDLRIPYEVFDNQNLSNCAKYKAPYIRSCLRMIKATHPNGMMGSKLSPEKYCECSYNTIAQQTYGADLLKDTVHLQIQTGNCNPN
jgi:hypothetical protein